MTISTTTINSTTVIIDDEYKTTDTEIINDILEQISQYYVENYDKFN